MENDLIKVNQDNMKLVQKLLSMKDKDQKEAVGQS